MLRERAGREQQLLARRRRAEHPRAEGEPQLRWWNQGLQLGAAHHQESQRVLARRLGSSDRAYKSDNAQGIWPAFWLLQEQINEAPDPAWACWPTNGAREIDIWEYSTNTGVAGLATWDSHITNFISGGACNGAWHNRVDVGGVNPYNMHTYRLEFWGGYLKIFVDGVFRREFPQGDFDDYNWFALFNVAVGGALGGPTYGW